MTRTIQKEFKARIHRASESDWSKQINDFLTWRGWKCIRTPATRMRYPSGKWGWIFEEGHADFMCVRPIEPGKVEMFYREDKRPGGATSKDRKVKQTEWAERMRECGYLVCSIPEEAADPCIWFVEWYKVNVDERRER